MAEKIHVTTTFVKILPKSLIYRLASFSKFVLTLVVFEKRLFLRIWGYIYYQIIILIRNDFLQFGFGATQNFSNFKSRFYLIFPDPKRNSDYCKSCF